MRLYVEIEVGDTSNFTISRIQSMMKRIETSAVVTRLADNVDNGELQKWKEIAAAGLPQYSALAGVKAYCLERGIPYPPPIPEMRDAEEDDKS